MHFHYITHMATAQHQNPCPGVMKFTILVNPSLVIITLYLVYLNYAWEYRRRFVRNNAFSSYNLYICPRSSIRTHAPGVMKYTIQVDSSLLIITIYMYLVCLIYAYDKKYIHFSLFTLKLPSLNEVGVMKFTISCLSTLKMLHTKFGQNLPKS